MMEWSKDWWMFGGYGFYVWGSYLVAFAVVAIEFALLVARRKRALRQLDDLEDAR